MQKYVLESLLGMGVVSPDLVLVVLGNGDSGNNADDRKNNQQLYEGETGCSLVGWMLLHDHFPRMAGNESIFCLWQSK